MSTALQFWSALLVPMAFMLAAPSLRWLGVLAPTVATAAVIAATFGPGDLWTGFLLLIALIGLGCGVALRVMFDFVRQLRDGG